MCYLENGDVVQIPNNFYTREMVWSVVEVLLRTLSGEVVESLSLSVERRLDEIFYYTPVF